MTIDLSTIEFHDTPPPSARGTHSRSPEMRAFLDLLKANPGKWAKYPHPVSSSMATTLKSEDFDAKVRNQDRATKRCELWVSWPAKPAAAPKGAATQKVPVTPSASPKAKPGVDPFGIRQHPPVKGKVVRCDDCDWETGTDHVADLDKHCRQEHNRPSSKVERMPVNASEAAA